MKTTDELKKEFIAALLAHRASLADYDAAARGWDSTCADIESARVNVEAASAAFIAARDALAMAYSPTPVFAHLS